MCADFPSAGRKSAAEPVDEVLEELEADGAGLPDILLQLGRGTGAPGRVVQAGEIEIGEKHDALRVAATVLAESFDLPFGSPPFCLNSRTWQPGWSPAA